MRADTLPSQSSSNWISRSSHGSSQSGGDRSSRAATASAAAPLHERPEDPAIGLSPVLRHRRTMHLRRLHRPVDPLSQRGVDDLQGSDVHHGPPADHGGFIRVVDRPGRLSIPDSSASAATVDEFVNMPDSTSLGRPGCRSLEMAAARRGFPSTNATGSVDAFRDARPHGRVEKSSRDRVREDSG